MSSTDTDSSSGSEEETPVFRKNVKFKKQQRKPIDDKEPNDAAKKEDTKPNVSFALKTTAASTSGIFDESVLYAKVSDMDPFTSEEKEQSYNLWKEREIQRLHRDRAERLERERQQL